MFKTKAFISEKVWGYERWIVSSHKAGESVIDGGIYDGQPLAAAIGKPYPLLIKVIQADETLSVQVHPDDTYAAEHENSAGKTECWYILDAKPDATLVYGLNGTYTRQELQDALTESRLDKYLRYEPVSKGDFVFIPAGTVHAIQGGLRLLEVQQPSDITYRLYDWGRPREVHIEKSLDVIGNHRTIRHPIERPFSGAFSCPYFSLNKQTLTEKTVLAPPEALPATGTASEWYSVFILSGKGNIQCGQDILPADTEDCFMIHAAKETVVVPDSGTAIELMLMYP